MSIDNKHKSKRTVLRIIGPILLVSGILLVVKGTSGMFGDPFTQSNFGGPSHFGLNFIGMPLIFVGGVMSSAGYMGAVARYQADEITPVAKDVVNYMADGTKDSVRTISKAIHEGMTDDDDVACQSCQTMNDSDSKFCKSCGDLVSSTQYCGSCGEKNDMDSKFCKSCGQKI